MYRRLSSLRPLAKCADWTVCATCTAGCLACGVFSVGLIGASAQTGQSALQLKIKLMKRLFCTILILSCLLIAGRAFAAPRIKVLKISVANPSDELRIAENIVVSVAE